MNKDHEQLHSNFNIKEEVEAELEHETLCHEKPRLMGTIELCQNDDSSSEDDDKECNENQNVVNKENMKQQLQTAVERVTSLARYTY